MGAIEIFKHIAALLTALYGLLLAQPDSSPFVQRLPLLAESHETATSDEPQPESPPLPVFELRKKPALEKVTYVGNRKFDDKALAKLTELKAGEAYDLGANRVALGMVQSHYRSHGYRYATVELEKGTSPDDREVVFLIDEGPKVVLTRIGFEGNKSVPGWVLRLQVKAMTLVPGVSEGLYDPEKLHEHLVAIKQFYQSLGYFDVFVRHREEASENLGRVELQFQINEGVRYRIRKVVFAGNRVVPEATLSALTNVHENDFYDKRVVTASKKRIEAHYRGRGRIYACVDAKPQSSDEFGTVDLAYTIDEDEVYGIVRRPVPVDADSAGEKKSARPPSLATQAPSRTGEPDGARQVSRITFTGVETFAIADIREALTSDFDLNLAAHPDIDLFAFMETLEAKIVKGYRHGGFPDAEATVAFNSTRKRIEVVVCEGIRCRCGDLFVTGTKRVSAETLLRALTEHSEPGRIVWKEGGPAPFDDERDDRIRERIQAEFAAAGYLCPDLEIRVHRDDGSAMANLEVTILDKGPPEKVGHVEVTGTKRDSAEDVLKYLHLQPGDAYDSGLRQRLERQLQESGRYLTVHIDERDPPVDSVDSNSEQALRISLRDYKQAPPLSSELSPAEQALLKLREWLERWSRGEFEEDLVVSLEIGPKALAEVWLELKDSIPEMSRAQAEGMIDSKISFQMVVGPQRGQTISLKAVHAGKTPFLDTLFAAYPDRLVLADLQRQAKLELRNSAKTQLILDVSARAVSQEEFEKDGKPFFFLCGMGMRQRSKPYPSSFEVEAEFIPAFFLSLAHDESSRSEFINAICKISTDDFEMQIDADSGRLHELRFKSNTDATLVVRMEKGSLNSEFARLEKPLAKSAVAYALGSPCKSAVEFLVDECVFAVESLGLTERAGSWRALRKLLDAWSPPGFDELCDLKADFAKPDDPFSIPLPVAGLSHRSLYQPQSSSRKILTGYLLPIYRRLVPQAGWLWPAGRDAALYWAAEEDSPGIHFNDLFIASLDWQLRAVLDRSTGSFGMPSLGPGTFADLCQPFLADDSWLGKWCLSLSDALGRLDAPDLQALAEFLPDDAPRNAIVECLTLLKARKSPSPDPTLRVTLDRFWADVVRPHVEAVLGESSAPTNRQLLKSIRDDQVRPAAAEGDSDRMPLELDDESTDPDPDEDLDFEPSPAASPPGKLQPSRAGDTQPNPVPPPVEQDLNDEIPELIP